MKFKFVFQVFVLLALMFGSFGASGMAQAKSGHSALSDAIVVPRDLTYWNATFTGSVDSTRYEKWSLQLSETNTFTITASATLGDFVPLISLLDLNGNEISTLAGSLAATQPAGMYYIQIQPQSGGGSYNLTIRKVDTTSLSASVTPESPSVNLDDSVLVRVSLNNVPSTGLTSAEVACTYDASILDISGITDSGLFGSDAVMVVNDSATGKFIVALAGSNGKKATTSGDAFVFYASGLKVGQTSINCTVRVSSGDKVLTTIPSASASITVVLPNGTLTGKAVAAKTVTVKVYDSSNAVVSTPTLGSDGSFSVSLPAGTYTVIASATGYLDAQGSVTITSGATTALSTANLPAGDIDGNDVIDQYDAMTIGMSYNTSTPAAADLNNDSVINVLDLELLAANYHKSGSLAWQ